MNTEISLHGKVLDIFFSNPSNLYKVMKIHIDEIDAEYDGDEIVVVGTFGNIQVDQSYEFFGHLTEHRTYGLQFQATRYQDIKPSSKDAVIKYLSNPNFKGIGKKTAETIVDILGVNCLDLIIDDASVLDQVPKLNKTKKDTIKEVLFDEKGIQRVVLKLNDFGISTEMAYRIYTKYNEKTLEVLQTNPYQLCYDIQNIGFHRADFIASEIGIEEDAPQRLYAGIMHTLNEHCIREGNTYLEAKELIPLAIQTLEGSKPFIIEPELIADSLLEMVDIGMVIQEKNKFYLPSLFASEWGIVTAVESIKETEPPTFSDGYLEDLLADVEESYGIQYGQTQREAILNAMQSPISILTGGPGTGKTTVLNGLIQLYAKAHKVSLDPNGGFYDEDEKENGILMAAPTGRAAKRMSETTHLYASTIHRLLGLTPDNEEKDLDEKLQGTLLIIDEMSMVDTWLAYQLLKAVPRGMQVVLVGDKNQLPSVGPGQVLKDLIESNQIPLTELTDIYRQGDGSSIVPLAYAIQHDQLPGDFLQKQADRSFIPAHTGQIAESIKQIITNALKKGFTVDDIQVLAPMYKGPAGINALNVMIQEIMNPNDGTKKEVKYIDSVYRIGDKVLHLVNDTEKNVFNGDIGRITGIMDKKEAESTLGLATDVLVIDFDGNEVSYPRNEWNKITLSYCCSIHKAQGSEYKMVILPLTRAFSRMLRKDLLYTAITRASDFLILCGELDAFQQCITSGNAVRQTTLKHYLNYDVELMDEETVSAYLEETDNKAEKEAEPIAKDSSEDNTKRKPSIPEMEPDNFLLTPQLIASMQIDPMIGMGDLTPDQC